MSYELHDSNGYLGDTPPLAGWVKFCKWLDSLGGEAKEFADEGWSEKLHELHSQLRDARSNDPTVEAMRQMVALLAARAHDILIVSDGESVGKVDLQGLLCKDWSQPASATSGIASYGLEGSKRKKKPVLTVFGDRAVSAMAEYGYDADLNPVGRAKDKARLKARQKPPEQDS